VTGPVNCAEQISTVRRGKNGKNRGRWLRNRKYGGERAQRDLRTYSFAIMGGYRRRPGRTNCPSKKHGKAEMWKGKAKQIIA